MLSRDCDGCPQQRSCRIRYDKVTKGQKVYCPDGTAHLVDQEAVTMIVKLPILLEVEN